MYPQHVQAFSDGYEQLTLRPIVAQIRRPMINNALVEDLHYWETGESESYLDEEAFVRKPGVSGYIRTYGTSEVGMDELFVTPQIADRFDIEEFEPTTFLIATADHASQLERFFA